MARRGGETVEIIDAHAHLFPVGFAGRRDERSGTDILPGGRVCRHDGEVVALMPERFADTSFPAETLLEEMDAAGVSRAVLMCNSLTDLEENVRAVNTWPERFTAAMTISQGAGAVPELEGWRRRGLTAVKFEMSSGLGYTNPGWYPDFRLDDPDMAPVYARAGELGIAVTVDPGPVGGKTYQVAALRAVTAGFPMTRFVICHLGFPDVPMAAPGHRALWREMASLAERENVWFDFAALTDFCRAETPAFPTPIRLVREFMDDYGPDRLLWGSDAPGALCVTDYPALLRPYLESDLFTEGEKRRIFAENAREAYGIN